MNYWSIDFSELRRLVLRWEEEKGEVANDGSIDVDGEVHTNQADDVQQFLSSNSVHRAMLAICSLRERATVIRHGLGASRQRIGWSILRIGDTKSIWFHSETITELESILPISLTCCPDLLTPENLVNALVTTNCAHLLLTSCMIHNPILRKKLLVLLGDFILKYTNAKRSGAVNIPFISYSLVKLISLCRTMPAMVSSLREILVRRRACVNIIFQMTMEDLNDVADFFSRIFFSDGETSSWFLSCMSMPRKQPEDTKLLLYRMETTVESEAATLSLFQLIESMELTEEMILQLRDHLLINAKAAFIKHQWGNKLCFHLKLYCFLIDRCGWQPLHQEVIFWFSALMNATNVSGGGPDSHQYHKFISRRMLELGIAFVFMVPGLADPPTTSHLQDCLKFLLGSTLSGPVFYEDGPEVALWLVVQLLLQCKDHVSKFVSNAIGVDLVINSKCWIETCHIAHEVGLTSNIQDISKAASCLRPTGPINSTKSSLHILECLCQLSKYGHFVRSRVDITEALMECIRLSEVPIHPMVVELIEISVKASYGVSAAGCQTTYRMKPIPYGFLAALLKPFCSYGCILENHPGDKAGGVPYLHEFGSGEQGYDSRLIKTKPVVQAVLASFFVLCKQSVEKSNADIDATSEGELCWSKLLVSLPLKSLFTHMERDWLSYVNIFPQWVSLANYLFPERLQVPCLEYELEEIRISCISGNKKLQLCQECFWMQTNGLPDIQIPYIGHEIVLNVSQSSIKIETAREIIRNSSVNCLPALALLEAIRLRNMPLEDMFQLQVVVMQEVLPLLLKNSCSEKLQEGFCQWWSSLEHIDVEVLLPLLYHCISGSTVNMDVGFCSRPANFNFEFPSLSTLYDELVEQPLCLLAFKKQVCHTSLLSVCLGLLMELLVKNKKVCLLAVTRDNETEKQEMLKILATRDSAVCQILLEYWSEMKSSSDAVQKDPLLRAGQRICAFISSLFYSNPAVFRLVHFQGYDKRLIPFIVEGVTLMRDYFDFLEDLLQFQELQTFVVILISNISRRHPGHGKSLLAAEKVLTHVRSIDPGENPGTLAEILEHVALLATVFPSLKSETNGLLNACLKRLGTEETSSMRYKECQDAAVRSLSLLSMVRSSNILALDSRWTGAEPCDSQHPNPK